MLDDSSRNYHQAFLLETELGLLQSIHQLFRNIKC